MSSFSSQLQETLKKAWDREIKSTQLWKSVIEGKLEVRHYAALLRETYHYTKRSPIIQSSAIPHFQVSHRDLVKPFLKHASEEEWHYKLCKTDLDNLGYSTETLDATNPIPATEGYLGFIFNRITFVNPLAYLGYLYNLEFMAIELGPEFIGQIAKNLNLSKNQLSFFRVHTEEDQDHVQELAKLVDKFVNSEKDRREIIYTAETATALYAQMMESAFSKPWEKGE